MIFGKEFLSKVIDEKSAIKGRKEPIMFNKSLIFQNSIDASFGDSAQQTIFGAGCFWGVEKRLWEIDGVISTSVGYAGGFTENPTYEEVCSGQTGHTEVV